MVITQGFTSKGTETVISPHIWPFNVYVNVYNLCVYVCVNRDEGKEAH